MSNARETASVEAATGDHADQAALAYGSERVSITTASKRCDRIAY